MLGAHHHHSHSRIETQDGLTLFCQAWTGDHGSRAVLAIVHGYGDHGGRYERVAQYFAPLGASVYAVDLRGHGQSPGKRGHINRFEDYLLDADALLKHVRKSEPDLPIFLLGHSMGGLVATRFVQEREIELAGLVLSSPFLKIKMSVPGWKRSAAAALSMLAPALTMPSDLNVAWLTRDPEIVTETVRDALVHRVATPRWYTETLKAQALAVDLAAKIRPPVLLQIAGDDRIADASETERFIGRLTSPKTVHTYDRLYHEIYNEIERETIFGDLERWIEARL